MPQTDAAASAGVAGGGPVVVAANWYRFEPEERIHNVHVESVCFVWTVAGSGTFICNGETFDASPDTLLRLPWAHDVEYRASGVNPFHVGTVHVVPWHDGDAPFVPRVAFRRNDPLLDVPWRGGGAVGRGVAAIPAHAPAGARMVDLAAYAVERFLADRTEEFALRAIGELLIDESDAWERSRSVRTYPATLNLMTRFVLENLDAALTVQTIAAAGAVSTATAERLFTRHTGSSVLAWVRERRMREAAVLLQTTRMRVKEVADRVGYPDPFYFSRVFTATFGAPPSRFADRLVRP